MKKALLFLLTIMLLGFAAAPVSAQSTLTVADGTETNSWVPFYGFYLDAAQHTQIIYPESMLTDMEGFAISQMEFYLSSNPSYSSNITIKLGITTAGSFSSTNFDNTTPLTEVYTGSIVIANNTMTVEFDSPFEYNGGNLLFDLTNTNGNYTSASFYGDVVPSASVNVYGSFSASLYDFIPKTTFTYSIPPLCTKPMNVTVTDVTTTNATVSWTGSDNASSYNVQYMLSSENNWENATMLTATDATIDLTGLQPSSTYQVRVQTVCSDYTETNWSNVVNFLTGCDAITITDSWFEDFEGYTGSGNQPFQCWARPIVGAAFDAPFVYCGWANSCHSGQNSAEMKGNTGETMMLLLPEFTNDINTLRLTFWATATSTAYGTLEVGVLPDMNDVNSFELVGTCGTPGERGNAGTDGNGNLMGPFDFNGIDATSGRIALRFTANTYSLSWNLDDFTVGLIPACAEPSGLANVTVNATSADITWNAIEDNVYDLVYWEVGSTDTTILSDVMLTDGIYTLDNLTPVTDYVWYVRTVCGDGTYSNSFYQVNLSTPGTLVEQLPYSRTFEELEEPTEIYFKGTVGMNQWTIGSGTFKPSDPSNPDETGTSMYISSDGTTYGANTGSGTYAYAIMDVAFPEGNVEYHLAFDYKIPASNVYTWGNYVYLSVYLVDQNTEIPTSSDPTGIVLLNQVNTVADWTHADIVLPNTVPGNTKKIVFYWYYYGYSYMTGDPAAIDNIEITSTSCAQPSNLSLNEVSTESATLTWVENGESSSWNVYYKASDETTYTEELGVSDTSLTIVGLTPNTAYEFYVVSDCGGESSSPSETFHFRTECGTIDSLPYTQDFEDASAIYSTSQDNYYACWDRYTSDPSHYVYVGTYSYYAHSGSYFLDFHYTPACFDIAIMPELGADFNTSDLMMSFYACKTGNNGYLEVGVMTNKFDPTTFVVIDTIDFTGLSTYTYAEQLVSFANYQDNGKYIAFRASNAPSNGFYLDDILLEVRPECAAPINLSMIASGDDHITLSWTELGTASSWNIEYGPVGFVPGEGYGTTVNASDNPYTVEGLAASTTYDFYVQSDCESEWCGPLTVATSQYIFGITGVDTITTCGIALYDDGGAYGNYSASCNYTVVVYPATEGNGLAINGSVNTYNSYASYNGTLTIYEGAGTTGPVLGTYGGQQTINLATSGPITVNFTSGEYAYYYEYPGFELFISCTECFPPTNVTVSDQTMDGATVTWTGNADNYAVYLSGGMTGYYTTNEPTYTFTGLNASSTYTVAVRALCGSDSSLLSSTASFNTSCGAITVTADNPWYEDFEGYSGSGEQPFVCWETPVTTPGGGPFVYCGYGPSAHSGANSAELKGYTNMLVLPEFSNDIHTLRLSFWATYYGSSTSAVIGVITDVNDTATFELLGDAGTPGPRGGNNGGNGNFMGPFDFNGVQAASGRIAILFNGSGTGSGWNLDDFTVELIPACPAPQFLTVSNIGSTSATVTWNSGANNFILEYGEAGFTPGEGTSVSVNTNSYDLIGLTPGTNYTVYVMADCGSDGTSQNTIVNFSTGNCEVEDQCVFTFNLFDTYGDGWNGGTLEVVQGGLTVATIGLSNGSSGSETVSLCQGISTDLVWVAGSYPGEASFSVTDPFGAVLYTSSSMATGTNTVHTFTPNCVGCAIPTDLVVSNIDLTSATINWMGSADSYTVEYGELGFTPGTGTSVTVTTTSYDLTGLTAATAYTVYVSAVCPDGNTSSPITVDFSTTICAASDQCAYTFNLIDSYGDGWNGGSMAVQQNGVTVATLALSTGSSATEIVNLCDNISTSLVWTPGNYDGEVGITLTGPDGTELLSVTTMAGYETFSFTPDCNGAGPVTCETPTNLTVANITENSAVASWTAGGSETAWNLQYKAATSSDWGTTIPCTQPTYTFTDLAASTQYMFRVQANCGDNVSEWSDATSFTTNSAPVITDPTVATTAATNITQTGATLNGTITNPDNVAITAKGFEWKATSGGTYAPVTVTGNNLTYNLTGLTANTGYTYKAFITFNGETVYGSEMTFTTLPEEVQPCDVPTNLHTTDIQNESIAIAWDANANVNSWNVQYRPAENGQWTQVTVNTNSYTITNLTGKTNYEIQVQANCGDGNLSDWSASITAQTTDVGIVNYLENSITLFPNPANDVVNVQSSMFQVQSIEVIDVYGKVINTVNVIDNPTRINVNGLASGMYFVRVTMEKGTVTKTFVKK